MDITEIYKKLTKKSVYLLDELNGAYIDVMHYPHNTDGCDELLEELAERILKLETIIIENGLSIDND